MKIVGKQEFSSLQLKNGKKQTKLSQEEWEEEKAKAIKTAKADYKEIVERKKYQDEVEKRKSNIIVTTGDLKKEYEVISPVFFQINDTGNSRAYFNKFLDKYKKEIEEWEQNNQRSNTNLTSLENADLIINALEELDGVPDSKGKIGIESHLLDLAFFISVQEIKLKAAYLGADAVIEMRQNIELDTYGFQHFYMQMYGTAIKFK